ncbi:MFS transporter [Geodermatophilus sabuli]|uniref:Predicted arabinose efflux permease, MFS family n=1 Tax=Geodermatophilus sabuli TaxID=1564158 RepID=A0A285EIM7_9ACTN|nr:MFS transporter [Geodermatophilus sabuli]MBB3086779.1 MFS family permease [Geodermatophilus sabuli]SNX98847.1 Predicted arabinose efflux permease, MFS family [Geodermatophilus sabuli]
MPYYPLYALLFLDTGLTGAQVSALFAVWSVTGLLTEVPAGILADRWSRRGVVVLGGVLQAAGFAVWTAAPATAAFAVGFVLWGVSSALVSGAAEALVYDGLTAVGAAGSYARVNGWMTAAELLVQVPTAIAASALFAVGGYPLVGWVSVGVSLAAAALALRLPEVRHAADDGEDEVPLRQGLAETLRRPGLRLTVLAVALLGGLDAMEEYFPVLAGGWGVPTAAVPFAVLAASLAGALGGALAGRAERLPDRALPALLVLAGLLLLVSAGWARPAALVALSAAYGLYIAVLVVGEARLQHRITGPHRATVTSVAGLGVELASLPVFAAWALGGLGGVAVVVLAVVPVVAAGLRSRLGAVR